MTIHHIQKQIIRRLLDVDSSGFSELKPDTLDNNIFTYHLKQLIAQDFVTKQDDGTYSLTATGSAFAATSHLRSQEIFEQAHSILLFVIRDAEGRYLLRRRSYQPMLGKIGFLHGEPSAHSSVFEAAEQRLKIKTGLTATLSVRGHGFIRLLRDDQVVSFTHFTLIMASDAEGKFIESDDSGENIWVDELVYDADEMIPSMRELIPAVLSESAVFRDATYAV